MDYIPLVISIVSVAGTIFSAIMSFKAQAITKRQEKEIQALKYEHERSMLQLQEDAKQQNRYEEHRARIIADYLIATKNFLGSPYNEAYTAFNRVSGEILMYVPDALKSDTQAMTRNIDEIYNAPVWCDDDGHDVRKYDIQKALERFYRLSESFSSLGFKPIPECNKPPKE